MTPQRRGSTEVSKNEPSFTIQKRERKELEMEQCAKCNLCAKVSGTGLWQVPSGSIPGRTLESSFNKY